jgi:two-component system phosphate regulon sensor histidine kinase PhoR
LLRSRFFWKLYGAYAGLVLAAVAGVGYAVDRQLERSIISDVQVSLQEKCLLAEAYAGRFFTEQPPADLEAEIVRLGHAANLRITLIQPGGKVLADSDRDPGVMENHWSREEVQGALNGPFGVAERSSATVGHAMMYVARAVRHQAKVAGVVRVALPLRAVEAQILALRATITAGAGMGAILALAVGMVISSRVLQPVSEMTEVAEGMRSGRYDRRILHLPHDELGVLGDTLNRLGHKVSEQITTISQEQAQLRSMLAAMVEGVIAVDAEDRVMFCNPAACQMLGVKDGNCAHFRDLSGAAPELSDLPRQARASGGAVRQEIALERGGADLALDAHATLFEGHAGGVVVVLEDITNLKRLERVRRDFVANVSHEIKTPLTSIKGYVETLLTGALHDETNNVRFLRKIEDHVGRLSNIVQDLLSLAKIEAQEGSAPLRPVDWHPIMESVIRRQEPAILHRGLSCKMESERPGPVLGDEEAMTQVLENLLDNAVKYTPAPGSIHLRLFRDNGFVGVEVADTGYGIPERDLERIFERFYRVDKARSREMGGTGLGLSIVKHLVQTMHGEVSVESEVGKGSRFRVLLPSA